MSTVFGQKCCGISIWLRRADFKLFGRNPANQRPHMPPLQCIMLRCTRPGKVDGRRDLAKILGTTAAHSTPAHLVTESHYTLPTPAHYTKMPQAFRSHAHDRRRHGSNAAKQHHGPISPQHLDIGWIGLFDGLTPSGCFGTVPSRWPRMYTSPLTEAGTKRQNKIVF